MIFPFGAAIFDMDGTLIDSMGVWEKIDHAFLARRHFPPSAEYTAAVKTMGFNEAADFTILRYGLSESREKIVEEWGQMAVDEYSHRIGLKPNVRRYLDRLKEQGVKLALATASPLELYEPVLKNNGVYQLFEAITSTFDIGVSKDHPDIYLISAEKLGVAPAECVVFEDVLPAVLSARQAGMQVVGVYDDYSAADEQEIRKVADLYIHDFGELI